MTLKVRRIMYLSFIVLFFLAAPPLVLYTAGFRYDFAYNRIVETGSLVAHSSPSDAVVYLNGEPYPDPTPTIINTILPGKINLLVQKEGYHSWEKILDIRARATSFEENIVLFADTDPIAAVEHSAVSYHWNRSQDKLAYVTMDNTLRLYNTLNRKDMLIANLGTAKDAAVSWSPHSDELFFARHKPSGAREYIIVNAQSLDRIIPLAGITSAPVEQVQWDPKNRASLYAVRVSSRDLLRLNYLTTTERVVYEGPVAAYRAENNRIILLSGPRPGSRTALSWINPADQSTVHLLPHVHASADHEIAETHSRRIALYHPGRRELLVIDPSGRGKIIKDDDDGITAIPGVREFIFTRDGATLAYSDGFGIYTRAFTEPISVLPRQKNASTLITRYSTPISSLALAGGLGHVFYEVAGEVRASEITTASDPRSTTLLSGLSAISGLKYSNRYDALLFIGEGNELMALPLSLENSGSFPFGN